MKKNRRIVLGCVIALAILAIANFLLPEIYYKIKDSQPLPLPNTEEDYISLRDAVDAVAGEDIQKDFGFDGVDFGKVVVGNAIHTYECLPEGFAELRIVYPLFFREEVIAVALRTDGGHFQLDAYTLPDCLDDHLSEQIAIVYDMDACYAFNGTDFVILHDGMQECEWRGNVENIEDIPALTENLILDELTPVTPLGYEP